MAATVLVVDDEEDIREIIRFNLEKEGFTVKTAASGLEGLKKTEQELPDLILLDIMMDGIDGLEVCRQLRAEARTRTVPVIFLTARSEELDRVLGLELGADDYITKPFSVRELVSRVRAVLRRSRPEAQVASQSVIQHETLELNLQSKRLLIDGRQINLTKKEYEIIHLFLTHPGQVLSREQIKEKAWDDETFIVDRAVDVHIRRLRSKLGAYAAIIVTYPGMGYGYKI